MSTLWSKDSANFLDKVEERDKNKSTRIAFSGGGFGHKNMPFHTMNENLILIPQSEIKLIFLILYKQDLKSFKSNNVKKPLIKQDF